ncbi:hypothetical protein NDU88_010951 [Pleurodeles waltl]|uniref:Uncharacterized protein n=1 Tax=Pleurodeles waltl TaxID=8319 RepID=A0AAV7QXU1_PLEWA|nr:hypothetical protein NDU88_010951 [Pleurodeles waltl]
MLLWPRRDQDVANCVRRQRGCPARYGALTEAGSTRRSAGTGTTKRSELELTEVAKEDPTTPEDNSGGCALQVRVSWTQARLCTKEILEECTGAGAAANHAVPSNAV